MHLPATPSAEGRAATTWRTLGRHQLGAMVATAVDFATMVGGVERLGMSPVTATAMGAVLGAVTNFLLGRSWIFRRNDGRWTQQAVRYAVVAGASAGWNALGEFLLHDLAFVPYLPARIVTSIAVSLLWNFPVQRRFVFRERRAQ
jgi:putative flippase GtrA